MGLRVLITNIGLWPPSGTPVYVRDLALELHRLGHTPIVFSSTAGGIAEALRRAGIEVTDKLDRVRETPDIIHGHHHAPTTVALRHWPSVPAIYVCHDHTSPYDRTPIHHNIRRYFGVSRLCVQRVVREGVPEDGVELLLNFVDAARFTPRIPLPVRPHRALVFSNYAHAGSHLPAVTEACRQAGLELDVAGVAAGKLILEPELLLSNYDIVFAKGKAAMEAMAVGSAVILCDSSGVGPMVTSARFDELRPLNFGFEALCDPLEPEILLREIARYDPDDAARVQDLVRSRAGLVPAVERLVAIYDEVIAEQPQGLSHRRPKRRPYRSTLYLRLYWRWTSVSPELREKLKRLSIVQITARGVRRILR